jgi:hypothetical protein
MTKSLWMIGMMPASRRTDRIGSEFSSPSRPMLPIVVPVKWSWTIVWTPAPSGPKMSTILRPTSRRRATSITTDFKCSHSRSSSGFSS